MSSLSQTRIVAHTPSTVAEVLLTRSVVALFLSGSIRIIRTLRP